VSSAGTVLILINSASMGALTVTVKRVSEQAPNGVDYIEQFQPTPCDAFNCHHRERCGKENLSCDAYKGYVQSGRPSEYRLILRKRSNGPKVYYKFQPTRSK